jgi:hypothetical protein
MKSPTCNVINIANADASTFPMEIYGMIFRRLVQQNNPCKDKNERMPGQIMVRAPRAHATCCRPVGGTVEALPYYPGVIKSTAELHWDSRDKELHDIWGPDGRLGYMRNGTRHASTESNRYGDMHFHVALVMYATCPKAKAALQQLTQSNHVCAFI